ncbi:MAG: DHH family phosphoesterase [Candidatus Taylorbacteria bacterium]
MDISHAIKEKAPVILAEIKKARSILLHCHPSPDPDSVCSALALKFACEQLGVKATVIRGDSEKISEGFSHFPGIDTIVNKSFGEVDLTEYDLFLIVDSGSPSMISYKQVPTFPLAIKSIVIDHHKSNQSYADINLVDVCSSTAFVLFQLFTAWGIEITHDIALNLFMGIYTDSGGLKYAPIDYRIFEACAILAKIAPEYPEVIFHMENSNNKESIYFEALALNSIELFLNDTIAIASVSFKQLQNKSIAPEDTHSEIPNKLKSVVGWNIGMVLTEREPRYITVSMRSRDAQKFDVSKLAVALGGGGHRAAAGIRFTDTSLEDAKNMIIAKAKELYTL